MGRALAAAPARLSWVEYGEGAVPSERAAAPAVWGDVVLSGRDLAASYHLAVVVDDALQGVSDVVRGRDLFAATAVHRLLQELLCYPAPRYRHHRLVLDRNGAKLSKSRQSESLAELRGSRLGPGRSSGGVGVRSGRRPARSRSRSVEAPPSSDGRTSASPRRHRRRRGRLGHELIDALALALERGEHLAVEFARAGELDRHRVDEVAVDDHLVMQVRSGRQSRFAEIADGLALDDVRRPRPRRVRSRTCDCRWSRSRWRAGFRPAARSRYPSQPR